jgi:hypothetical protein
LFWSSVLTSARISAGVFEVQSGEALAPLTTLVVETPAVFSRPVTPSTESPM